MILYTIFRMAESKRFRRFLPMILLFVLYALLASQPVQEEDLLMPAWVSSLEAPRMVENPQDLSAADLIPFRLDTHFGWAAADGSFAFVKSIQSSVAQSDSQYCEYGLKPEQLEFRDHRNQTVMTTRLRGYPFLDDGNVYLIGEEQHSVIALAANGSERWRREFPATLTCADAAAGFLAVGMLNGAVEVLGPQGDSVFSFEPGASRLALIASVNLSSDARRLGIVSGADPQRMLMLERGGTGYKVVWHSFIGAGFRRPVLAGFTDDDRWFIYERSDGLGIYDCQRHAGSLVPLPGELRAFERQAEDNRLFALAADADTHILMEIRLPDTPTRTLPYRGEGDFLLRREGRLYVGGSRSLLAIDLITR